MPAPGHRIDLAPSFQAASCGGVPLDQLIRGQLGAGAQCLGRKNRCNTDGGPSERTSGLAIIAGNGRHGHSTIKPSAWNVPITTLTRSPRFTMAPLFEKAIQYS